MRLPYRILAKLHLHPSGCIVWTGGTSRGYGKVRWQGKLLQAHRLVWESVNGPIPSGLVIDHLCRNRACCNVDHLRVVTTAENLKAPGSLWCGNRHRESLANLT